MPVPLIRPLGVELGERAAAPARGSRACGSTSGRRRRVRGRRDGPTGVTLDDGTELAADVVVEAVGCAPNVAGSTGNGLDLTDGVRCDDGPAVVGTDGPSPAAVAVGDIARFPNLLFDDVPRRVEHWNIPTETGKRAARVLGAGPRRGGRGRRARARSRRCRRSGATSTSCGCSPSVLPGLGGDDIRVLEGELPTRWSSATTATGILVGVVMIGLSRRYSHYRDHIIAASPYTLARTP